MNQMGLWYESLAFPDYSVPRSTYDFKNSFIPLQYEAGKLAESWEIATDWTSYTFNIRQGVYWQNIAPMNGREFTAQDVVWNEDRDMGLGGVAAAPLYPQSNFPGIVSVTATGPFTVVYGLAAPSMTLLSVILGDVMSDFMMPPEAVQLWGNVQNPDHQIGTGPFILQDYVAQSSMTCIRNPNYYLFDPKNPKNQLPYVSEVRVLNIPDVSTAISALRTGKLSLMEAVNWQTAAATLKSSPQLQEVTSPLNGPALAYRLTVAPYNNIQVRQAIQMAIDLSTIASSYLGGTVPGTPTGTEAITGYCWPFAQWPTALQGTYLYNPTAAKQLLTAAGYPNGFSTTLAISTADDSGLFQIVKSYLAAVNINVTIQVMDPTSWAAYLNGPNNTMCSWTQYGWQGTFPVVNCLNNFYSKHPRTLVNGLSSQPSTAFDAIYAAAAASLDPTKYMGLIQQADMYAIEQQWQVNLLPRVSDNIYQPSLHGYQGEDRMLITDGPYIWLSQN